MAALAWVGLFGVEEIELALTLIAPQLVGFGLSFPAKRLLADHSIRPIILGLSSVAALVVLGRVVFS